MIRINFALKKFQIFNLSANNFARFTNTKMNKSVLLNNTNNNDESLAKENEENNNKENFPLNEKTNIEHNQTNSETNKSDYNNFEFSEKKYEQTFNFESFKNRNLEISKANSSSNPKLNSKTKSKKQKEENEDEENNKLSERQEFDNKLLSQLNKYIQEDTSYLSELGKKVNQTVKESSLSNEEVKEEQNEEESENRFEGVLVKRPIKGFVWGMGNQTQKKKYKFEQGEIPTIDSLVKYLQASNLKDIVVVPTKDLGFNHLKETSIVSVGFSSKHIYKSAKDLNVEIKNLQIPEVSENMQIYGRRDEEWLLLEIGKDISLYFFTEAFNKEVDIINIWTNRLSDEEISNQSKLKNTFYKNRYKKF